MSRLPPSPGDVEYERFSPDQDWMPNVVMIAKSTTSGSRSFSRQYGRAIERLDQIPTKHWKPSLTAASTRCGSSASGSAAAPPSHQAHARQQDAVASAYSLFEYNIAGDLGGDYAYNNLRERAARYAFASPATWSPTTWASIPWVIEHPEWFLSRTIAPGPPTTSTAPTSPRCRVSIRIEDHYYDQSDAAVVFQRRDIHPQSEYIYTATTHQLPWNDTAQLNYLRADVRERVIQTSCRSAHVPIIRFDAP